MKSTHLQRHLPDRFSVDERDLKKLISCVLLNAVKFTEEGSITLRAGLTSKAKYIVINVIDTGSGIPEAFQPYLFQAFSREDDSLTRQKDGLGLGLMVAKGLARRIGGDLQCVRTDVAGPQRGSEFELRIPLSSGEPNSRATTPSRTPTPCVNFSERNHNVQPTSSLDRRRTPRSRPTPKASKSPDPLGPASNSRRNSLSRQLPSTPARRLSTRHASLFDRNLARKYPLSFLVAEDNKLNRKLLVNMLGKLGYTTDIHEAYDGVEAVRQMSIDREARGEKPIDVILMDLWMPNMDGYEATERILAMEKERRKSTSSDGDDDRARSKDVGGVTVLAVSADVTDHAIERADEVGMGGYMTKPYKLVDLERLILHHCAGGGALEAV